MQELNEGLKNEFRQAAGALRKRLEQRPNRAAMRAYIAGSGMGRFTKSRKMSNIELEQIAEKGGIAGVDGSTNSAGGIFPYVITLQQAMAKSTVAQEEIYFQRVMCPLLFEEALDEAGYQEMVKSSLAGLEARAALSAIEKFSPAVLLIDGSLVRLKIEAKHLWEKLKEAALDSGTLLAGVVEGISTRVISSALKGVLPEAVTGACDWELLFGVMDVGEGLEVAPGCFKEGFRTVFMRTSGDPKPIGIDLLEEQYEHLELVENLIYTLTPESGRGIPLWLDLIDKKVKISDATIEGLLKTYLGQDYAEFLTPKRAKRSP
ncbi:NurA domain protein [Thermosediminibacter oceani DSM 16646]|uniref:NurA domain protein n=1 Tax=Thermosediminibacter oceani (strain ATCC BAA-1034 / DSM 16646 / JW/IW-1228P) TaxID=555079 RepID=D9RZC5_THEOJ|nr:DNA double-strand break repair nuclease NurA [Thermosediminibacter oceani]ADL06823.1 NurA domain protein [Thermosediminibacter oceani DSM 16646]